MGFYDLSDDEEVYACPLTINTGRQANDTVQIFSFINDQIKAELSKHTPEERQAFEDVVKNVVMDIVAHAPTKMLGGYRRLEYILVKHQWTLLTVCYFSIKQALMK